MAPSRMTEKQVKSLVNIIIKAFTASPKSIIFNKTIMAKYPNMELDNATIFKTLPQMIRTLSTENDCREHLEQLRWNGEPICPHCGSQRENHYKLKEKGIFRGLYKCKDCRMRFTVKVGTMFHNSAIPLTTWFYAIHIFTNHKKGISSAQLSRDTGVTQKNAWHMLNRMRNTFKNNVDFQFDGIVQIDETYVGGLNLNRNKDKRKKGTQGRSSDKTPVFGIRSNDGLVYIEVVPNAQGSTLVPIIKEKVKEGSTIVSDGWKPYRVLSKNYKHKVIKHNRGVFKMGQYHTNGIENFWSHFKRGVVTYHSTSPKHLHRYCDEFAYRYNTRDLTEGERFNLSLINSDERLTYKELISA